MPKNIVSCLTKNCLAHSLGWVLENVVFLQRGFALPRQGLLKDRLILGNFCFNYIKNIYVVG
jgi:hypothetical protein